MTSAAFIADAFAGHVVHVEPAILTGWPSAAVLDGLAEGELWVAKDLTAEAHPRSAWIAGRPLYANDWTAVGCPPIAGRSADRLRRCAGRRGAWCG